MKEIEKILKTVSDGLKLASQGILSLAEKVNEAAKTLATNEKTAVKRTAAAGKPKTKSKTSKKGKTVVKTIRTKKAAGGQSKTAIDTVFDIVKKSDMPVGTAALREKTGFESKKIANVLFKLKKQGKIKSAGKGVYTVA